MYVLSLIKCIYNSGLHSKSSRCTVLEAFLKALYNMRMQINTWPRILEGEANKGGQYIENSVLPDFL